MLAGYRVQDIRAAEVEHGGALMEHAAFAIASRAADLLVDLAGRVYGSTVLLLVGPGANGGDALHAGAHLLRRGARVLAVCTTDRWHVGGMSAFTQAGGRVVGHAVRADLVIDGIVGMGGRDPIDPQYVQAIGDSFVLSVDLPSGVDADTGVVAGAHIDADLTLATGAYKAAHLVDPARAAAGVIELIDLDLDLEAYSPSVRMWQREDVRFALALHRIDPTLADKYRRGVLTLLAGSTTYPGAGLLTARGAINIGTGMIRHLGALDVRWQLPELVAVDGQSDALAIGPGLTESEREPARALLERELPAVIDAGAIAWVEPGRAETLITPHAGELARLLGVDRSEVERDRLAHLHRAVDQFGVTVLLKGSTTLIGTPSGEVYANPTGSPALATAGSGDVLTGVIGGLLAQGCDITTAAVAGAWLHGLAGAYAQSGASAIAELIPTALALMDDGDD